VRAAITHGPWSIGGYQAWTPTLRRALAAAVCGALIAAPPADASPSAGDPGPRGAAQEHVTMVGNTRPYPELRRASRRNVRKARRLQRASLRTARRFDTVTKAKARGYTSRRTARPGFVHFRKWNVTDFWGRVLDPAAPPALVFWCVRGRRCTLTAYMYRAPAGPAPSTWDRILQWHRHGDHTATWITHVWLVPDTRAAFATCAPWPMLRNVHGLRRQRYQAHVGDRPCSDSRRRHPASASADAGGGLTGLARSSVAPLIA
jgi:hypothetical protein